MVESLFPAAVAVAEALEEAWRSDLLPEEETHVARMVPRRRREFAAGRACAREALAQLGWPATPIGRRDDRAPVWPAGVVGSISHCEGLCAAVVARAEAFAGLGLDVERVGRVRPALLARISSSAERSQLEKLAAAGLEHGPTLLFSAKESVYKCYRPLVSRTLGYRDVEASLDPSRGTIAVRMLRRDQRGADLVDALRGRFSCEGPFVATGVWLAAGATPHR